MCPEPLVASEESVFAVCPNREPEDFGDVLRAAARLQEVLGDAVLVGGTAAAVHAGHRVSFDDDHALADLRERFDDVLDALEATDGWATARVQRPLQILGNLDGVDTGVRQLRRSCPLEVEEVDVGGRRLRLPTPDETLRIKAWLVLVRNATRDHLDVAALAERIGMERAGRVCAGLDRYYAEVYAGPGGAALQLAKQLADPCPYDLDSVDLAVYRHLALRWRTWEAVAGVCAELAVAILDQLAEGSA